MRSSLALLTAFALLGGCSGEGNTGQPERNFSWVDASGATLKLWEQVPWANHGLPQLDAMENVLMARTPLFPPVSSGMVDPGSQPVDCSALDEIELSPYYVDTFEPFGGAVGVAPGWSGYDDGSDASFRVPGDASWYPGLDGIRGSAVFGLASDTLVGERPLCDGAPNDWALHFRGGRFNWYGGGMAHPFAAGRFKAGSMTIEPCPAGSDLCPTATPEEVFGPARSGNAYLNDHNFWDASQYDGIVFWARRGPEGATGLLVGLQDKYNSDDLARENERFCKRFKPCVPSCTLGRSCIAAEDGFNRCLPDDFPAGWNLGKIQNESLRELLFPRCLGATKDDTCVPPDFYPDLDFNDTECKWHSFTGREEGYWCSGDAPPAAAPERCGDNYVAPISLSTDWQLFKLPFDSFRQVGFGKRSPKLDLKTLYSIAFQFTVGYTDVYVDNLSLYRNKQP